MGEIIFLILEVFGEIFLQFFAEALVEMGFHSFAEPFRRRPNPWLAALGYALFGIIFGALSLLVFPQNLVPAWRLGNLIIAPFAVGGLMVLIGAWRARREQTLLRIDRFVFAYLFALSFAGVRFCFAQ